MKENPNQNLILRALEERTEDDLVKALLLTGRYARSTAERIVQKHLHVLVTEGTVNTRRENGNVWFRLTRANGTPPPFKTGGDGATIRIEGRPEEVAQFFLTLRDLPPAKPPPEDPEEGPEHPTTELHSAPVPGIERLKEDTREEAPTKRTRKRRQSITYYIRKYFETNESARVDDVHAWIEGQGILTTRSHVANALTNLKTRGILAGGYGIYTRKGGDPQ